MTGARRPDRGACVADRGTRPRRPTEAPAHGGPHRRGVCGAGAGAGSGDHAARGGERRRQLPVVAVAAGGARRGCRGHRSDRPPAPVAEGRSVTGSRGSDSADGHGARPVGRDQHPARRTRTWRLGLGRRLRCEQARGAHHHGRAAHDVSARRDVESARSAGAARTDALVARRAGRHRVVAATAVRRGGGRDQGSGDHAPQRDVVGPRQPPPTPSSGPPM